MQQTPKFKCSACGTCCKNISGLISSEEKSFIEEYAYGKMPLVQVIPPEEMSFPLWDFEAKRFKEYAKEKNIDAKIRPSRGIFDLNTNTFIIVTYHMNSVTCPFLADGGKCVIYNTKRAFVCHLFPFNRSPFLDMGKESPGNLFGSCPNISEITGKLDFEKKETLVKELYSSFGDSFLSAVQHDHVMEWSNKLILELVKSNVIRPALNYPYSMLKKRIENARKIDFTEFLVEIGYKSNEEIQKLVSRFEKLADANEKLAL